MSRKCLGVSSPKPMGVWFQFPGARDFPDHWGVLSVLIATCSAALCVGISEDWLCPGCGLWPLT